MKKIMKTSINYWSKNKKNILESKSKLSITKNVENKLPVTCQHYFFRTKTQNSTGK
jgi:hypothetical protein